MRQHGGDRDADLGVRGVQLRLGGPYIGPLLDEFRGQAQRQLGRQLQRIELEGLGDVLVRQLSHQCPEEIARLFELRLQRGEQHPGLTQRGFLGRDIDAHGEAQPELVAQDGQ